MQPDVNLKGIGETLAENTLKTKEPFPYAGMWLFSGSQGSGKTLLMMHLLKEIYEKCPDCIIVSNISIYGIPSIPYTGIEQIINMHNGNKGIIFVIDEIQALFNSLESKNMPLTMVQEWCQNRKNRRLILGTSQIFSRIGKPIREQCTWNYHCRRNIFNIFYPYSVYDGSLYNDSGEYIGENPAVNFYVPKVSVMRMYNTLEVVKRDNYNQ